MADDLTPIQKRARDLYAAAVMRAGGVDTSGAPLPQWADLPADTQAMWVSGANRAKQLAADNVADADEMNTPPREATDAQLAIWRAYSPIVTEETPNG